MISWVTNLFKKKKHDKIVNMYRFTAYVISKTLAQPFGRENTIIGLQGQRFNVNSPELYHLLNEHEAAYAQLGYRIIPLYNWIDLAGWGVSIDHLWLVKREEEERPIFTKFIDATEILGED